ncbi:unnamed protein product [Amoebophrya sp. A25]|nr:unnamed protein product [Amoebophrya sp. A25]|eukprot:GSA25T00011849001.1
MTNMTISDGAGATSSTSMFSAIASRNRCLALHQLREDADCDALVVVLGSDARAHRGSELVFLYSILGFVGPELALRELDFDEIPKELLARHALGRSKLFLAEPTSTNNTSSTTSTTEDASAADSVGVVDNDSKQLVFDLGAAERISDAYYEQQRVKEIIRRDDIKNDIFAGTHCSNAAISSSEEDEVGAGGGSAAASTGGMRRAFGTCLSDWDEVFFVFHKHRNFVFVPNHTIARALATVCALWPNLEIRCCAEWPSDYESKQFFLTDPKGWREKRLGDRYDEIKIRAFIEALNYPDGFGVKKAQSSPYGCGKEYCRSVGVFGSDVEQWPLVQAYALDDFGNHGFLSMNKTVRNLESELEHIFAVSDWQWCARVLSSQESLKAAFVEAVSNRFNAEACMQHSEYGEMNHIELMELLPARGAATAMREKSSDHQKLQQASSTFTDKSTHVVHEVVCPTWRTYFARTVPKLSTSPADSSSSPSSLLSDIVLARHCVEAFTSGPSGPFPVFDVGGASDAASSSEDGMSLRYRAWLPIGADQAARIDAVRVRKIDAFGFVLSPEVTSAGVGVGASDDPASVKSQALPIDGAESGISLVSVRVRVGEAIWGDSFLYVRSSPRAPAEVVRLSCDNFPAPFFLNAQLLPAKSEGHNNQLDGGMLGLTPPSSAEKKEFDYAAEERAVASDVLGFSDPDAFSKAPLASSTDDVLVALCLPTAVGSVECDDSSLLCLGSGLVDLKSKTSSLALFPSRVLRYQSRDTAGSRFLLRVVADEAAVFEVPGSGFVYCKATSLSTSSSSSSTPSTSGGGTSSQGFEFFVRLPSSWLSLLDLRVGSTLAADPRLVSLERSLHARDRLSQFAAKGTETTLKNMTVPKNNSASPSSPSDSDHASQVAVFDESLTAFKTAAVFSDSHLARMPPNSRRAVFGIPKHMLRNDIDATTAVQQLWINVLPGSAEARSTRIWAEKLARRTERQVLSLREVYLEGFNNGFNNGFIREFNTDDKLAAVAMNAIIVNDLGLPLTPPPNAYCVTNLADLVPVFARCPYHISPWLRALVQPGFCHMGLLPNNQQGSSAEQFGGTCTTRTSTSTTSSSPSLREAQTIMEQWVKTVNPEVILTRPYLPDEYFASRLLGEALRIPSDAVRQRLLSQPGCLDQTPAELAGAQLVCISLPAGSLYERSAFFEFLCKEMQTNKNLLSVEVRNVKTAVVKKRGLPAVHSVTAMTLDASMSNAEEIITRLEDDEQVQNITTEASTTANGNSSSAGASSSLAFWLLSPRTVDSEIGREGSSSSPWSQATRSRLARYLAEPVVDHDHVQEHHQGTSSSPTSSCSCVLRLTPALPVEVNDIEMQLISRDEPLPDGFWFDGEHYVDFTGKKQKKHPEYPSIFAKVSARRVGEAAEKNVMLIRFMQEHGLPVSNAFRQSASFSSIYDATTSQGASSCEDAVGSASAKARGVAATAPTPGLQGA